MPSLSSSAGSLLLPSQLAKMAAPILIYDNSIDRWKVKMSLYRTLNRTPKNVMESECVALILISTLVWYRCCSWARNSHSRWGKSASQGEGSASQEGGQPAGGGSAQA